MSEITVPERTPSVIDGKLVKFSPSLLKTFDPTTPFGCERRGYYKYVMLLEEDEFEASVEGKALHKSNELFLNGEPDPNPSPLFMAGRRFLSQIDAAEMFPERMLPTKFSVLGVPISRHAASDLVTYTNMRKEGGIYDWKTTSNFKYCLSKEELALDTQMLIYAAAFHERAERIMLTHGYYLKGDKPDFRPVSVTITQAELRSAVKGKVIPLVKRVADIAGYPDEHSLPMNVNACGEYRKNPCPHLERCRGIVPKNKKEVAIMPLFRPKTKEETMSAPEQQPEQISILPPDAPASNPELASAKSKSKTKIEKTSVKYEKVSVQCGATLNLGNFNNYRLDIRLDAVVSGDVDEAYQEILKKCKEKLLTDLEELKKNQTIKG